MKNDAEKMNPCLHEQNLSYKCFDANNFNKDACEKEIKNYNICKSFWVRDATLKTIFISKLFLVMLKLLLHHKKMFQNSIKSDRRRKGIRPYLPPPEEREQIKRDFFVKFLQQQT